MNLLSMMRGLGRRWYIVVPGVILTLVAAFGVWNVVKPDYERTATQLLLPGIASIPEAGNPYLYLGGLSQAADVLVTAMSAQSVMDELVGDRPGVEIAVTRDPMTSGPQLLLTVTGPDDSETGDVLEAAIARSVDVLNDLQRVEGITEGNRISIETITQDTQSIVQQRNRVVATAGVAVGVLLLTLATAALVDGMSTRRRRRGRIGRADATDAADDIDTEEGDLDADAADHPGDADEPAPDINDEPAPDINDETAPDEPAIIDDRVSSQAVRGRRIHRRTKPKVDDVGDASEASDERDHADDLDTPLTSAPRKR